MKSIPMPTTFLNVPELLDELPGIDVKKDLPYRKENRLDRLSYQQNMIQNNDIEKQTIIDLPIKVIAKKIINTITSIINDLADAPEYSVRRIIMIFTDGDRLIYVGLLLFTIALILFLVEMTS